MKKSISSTARDDLIARVLDDMNKMPLARAQVAASGLYSEAGLREVKDPLLKSTLCRALAKKFKGTSASALSYWESF